MNPALLFIFGLIINLLPDTRFFGFKRLLYRTAGATIGKNVRICSSVKISGNGKLIVGDGTWIGHETLIISSSSIMIGCNVDIAPRVYLGTGTHEINLKSPGIAGEGISRSIIIGDGCWLGVGSTILPGTELGDKCIVAAGAVLTKNFPSYKMVAGVPAKIIKDL